LKSKAIIVGDLGKTQLRLAEARGHQLLDIQKFDAPEAGTAFWEELVERVVEYATAHRPTALKLAVAGAVRGGEVASPHARGSYPLGPVLRERLGVEVALANDLQAAALGELHQGAARGVFDALVAVVSTGINAVVIKNGVVLPNPAKLTEEFGHREVPRELRLAGVQPDPGCGRICWETHVSGVAVYERARAAGLKLVENRDFDRLAARGDAMAVELYEQEGRLLAEWLGGILLDRPAPLIVLQGTFARRGFEYFEWPLRDHLSQLVGKVPELKVGELGDEAGLIGATYLR
jgi:glucokinase